MRRTIFSLMLLSTLGSPAALAGPLTLSFTATGFAGLFTAGTAPVNAVSGTATYLADAQGRVSSLLGFSLAIDGFSYGLSNMAVQISSLNNIFFGTPSGQGLSAGDALDDFRLSVNFATSQPSEFLYTTAARTDDIWRAATLSATVGAASVPAPATLWLTGLGLAGLLLRRGPLIRPAPARAGLPRGPGRSAGSRPPRP